MCSSVQHVSLGRQSPSVAAGPPSSRSRATVVVAQVPPNDGPLYQSSGVFWQRRGSHTTPMTAEELHAHLHAAGVQTWEQAICRHAELDHLDTDLIDRYLNLRMEHSRINLHHMPREEMLIRLKCAARDAAGQVRPTNVGMLLFGLDPQLFIPQSEVVCVRYADSLSVGKYQDRKNIGGTITEIITKAADFLRLDICERAEIIWQYAAAVREAGEREMMGKQLMPCTS